MSAEPQNKDTKKYYAIGEVAQLLHVSTSLIRFWEKKFPSLQPTKNRQGMRRYTHTNITQLKTIYQLVKEQGYTLEGAKIVIKNRSRLKNHEDTVQELKQIRHFLLLLKENIRTAT